MLEKIKKFVSGIAKPLGLDILVVSLVDVLKKAGQKHAEDVVKGFFLGVGVNDEILFQNAIALAVLHYYVAISDINKIVSVINSYSEAEKSRIIQIIGKTEEEIGYSMPLFDESEQPVLDPKTKKQKFQRVNVKANVKGAHTIVVLSKMSEEEIKNFFEGSGALRTFGKRIEPVKQKFFDNVEKIITNLKLNKSIKDLGANANEMLTEVENILDTSTPIKDFFNYWKQ